MHCNARWAEGGGIDQAWARSTLAARHHQLALNYFSAPPAGCKIISRKMQLVQDYLKSTTGALVKVTIASPLVPPNHQSVLKGDWIFNIHQRVQLHHHPDTTADTTFTNLPNSWLVSMMVTRWPCWWGCRWPDRAPRSCIFSCVCCVCVWACRWPGTKTATWPGTRELYFCVCVFVFVCSGSIQQGLCLCVCVWRRAAVNMQFSNSRGGDWSRCNGTDGDSS